MFQGKATLNFDAYKYISKRHFKMILPDADAHNSKNGNCVALHEKAESKSKIIKYLAKGDCLIFLGVDGGFARVGTTDKKTGYVNISCLDTIQNDLVEVVQPSGLKSSEINLLLASYAKCDWTGTFRVKSMKDLAKDICVGRATLYRALSRLVALGVLAFDREKRTIQLLGYAFNQRKREGYAEISTRMLSKKFYRMSIDRKRLALYFVSMQAKLGIKISFKKLCRVSRKNSKSKVVLAIKTMGNYFLLSQFKRHAVIDTNIKRLTVHNAIEHIKESYFKTKALIKASNLGQCALSAEDYFLLAKIHNNYSPPDNIMIKVFDSAAKNFGGIEKSLPGYVTGAIKKQRLATIKVAA